MVTSLDWSDYVGRIAIGRIRSGAFQKGQTVTLMQTDDRETSARIVGIHVFDNLGRKEVESASAGDVIALTGLEKVEIGDTVCLPSSPIRLPRIKVDLPTLEMIFTINSSPMSGREGRYLTSRQLRERLMRELERNVALRVTTDANPTCFGSRAAVSCTFPS